MLPTCPSCHTFSPAFSRLHREVLLLRYQDDLSYEEIAAVVGCSVGTVKSRLHHAKRRLQSEYANSRGDES